MPSDAAEPPTGPADHHRSPGADGPRRGGGPSSNSRDASNLNRLLEIIMLLQAGGRWDPPRLSEHFRIDVRTVHRDLKKLRATGVPIEFNRQDDSYRLGREFFLQPVQLAPDEALALAALCSHVAEQDLIGFTQPANRALVKILGQLPADVREDVHAVTGHMAIRTGPTAPSDSHQDVYEKVRQAISERLEMDCEYEPAGRAGVGDEAENEAPQRFRFRPYALYFGVRAWYAIGERDDRDSLRMLKLSRFGRAEVTNVAYEIPAEFSIDTYLRNAWQMIPGDTTYSVEIHFGREIADRVAETQWHRTQEVEEHADGSATFRCTVDGLEEIIWWVLSFGPSCRVIKPRELADRVVESARRVLAAYE